MNERDQFTFYKSFLKGIKRIKDPMERAAAYDAICDYAIYGILPDTDTLPDAVAMAFDLMFPVLESGRNKAVAKMSEQNGKTSEQNFTKSKDPGTKRKEEKEKETETYKEKDKGQGINARTRAKFEPPTHDEVAEYCKERGINVDPDRFIDFYTSKGWIVGHAPMKDWKSALRNWERRDKERDDSARKSTPEHPPNNKFHNFDQRSTDYDAFLLGGA